LIDWLLLFCSFVNTTRISFCGSVCFGSAKLTLGFRAFGEGVRPETAVTKLGKTRRGTLGAAELQLIVPDNREDAERDSMAFELRMRLLCGLAALKIRGGELFRAPHRSRQIPDVPSDRSEQISGIQVWVCHRPQRVDSSHGSRPAGGLSQSGAQLSLSRAACESSKSPEIGLTVVPTLNFSGWWSINSGKCIAPFRTLAKG